MTLIPHDNRDVKGLSGDAFPAYKTKAVCACPGCSRWSDHRHHIWRRSFIGGDFSWVELWDHTIVGNCVGLCWRHHQEITENRARIVWAEEGKIFVWVDGMGVVTGELTSQPPMHGAPAAPEAPEPFSGPAMSDVCPGCKRPLKKAPAKTEGARRRKTWTVSVPDDGEDGALVLDELLALCRDLFQHGEEKNLRYFTLVQALALVVQHGHVLVSESSQNAGR